MVKPRPIFASIVFCLRRRAQASLLVAAILCTWSGQALAALPVPPGLTSGQKYHLVFNSSSVIQGLSSNIVDYNALVQQAADAAGVGSLAGVTWKAIVSTPTVHARNNAVVGAATPVYNMNLVRVANNFADMWDGVLAASPNYDETGSFNNALTWTGSLATGLGDPGFTLGNSSAAQTAWTGAPVLTDSRWIHLTPPASLFSSFHIYGLSQELTVPIAGDLDANGAVDGNDFLRWQRGYPTTYDTSDLADIKANFGIGYALPAVAATPEPTSEVLVSLVLGAIALTCLRRIG